MRLHSDSGSSRFTGPSKVTAFAQRRTASCFSTRTAIGAAGPCPPNSMITQRKFWRYVRGLAPPVLILGVFIAFLLNFLRSDRGYDEAAMQEWIEETPAFHDTLPVMVREYLHSLDEAKDK